MILSGIYSIIVAPITEELLMRGFVQKNLSRVSQRFGIVMTAFIFGIWHENVAQFLLAFVGGIFFGYIAAKHDSLIPSIICHIVVNSFAEAGSVFSTHDWKTATFVLNVIYFMLVFIGLIMLIRMCITERFPRSTPHQAERGLRQVFACPLLLVTIGCHIAIALNMIAIKSA
jgi:hypothetical protein